MRPLPCVTSRPARYPQRDLFAHGGPWHLPKNPRDLQKRTSGRVRLADAEALLQRIPRSMWSSLDLSRRTDA